MRIVHVIGVTCSGKSTLMDVARNRPLWGTVEVGKLMRAKYPPEYFAGQCNPTHTADEAWRMYLDGLEKNRKRGTVCCFVDGQPRDQSQFDEILQDKVDTHHFLHLWAPKGLLLLRSTERDGADEERLKLSSARIDNDVPALYMLLSQVLAYRLPLRAYNTSDSEYDPMIAIKESLSLGTL